MGIVWATEGNKDHCGVNVCANNPQDIRNLRGAVHNQNKCFLMQFPGVGIGCPGLDGSGPGQGHIQTRVTAKHCPTSDSQMSRYSEVHQLRSELVRGSQPPVALHLRMHTPEIVKRVNGFSQCDTPRRCDVATTVTT